MSLKETEMDDLNVGDVVCLKSGGPSMSVEVIHPPEDGQTRCKVDVVWFIQVGNTHDNCTGPHRTTFPVDAVSKIA